MRALNNELGTTPIAHASQLAPMVMQRCMNGRGAIGLTLTYIDSQQPFPYVHLLALLTDMALCVNSATVGLQTGRSLYDHNTTHTEVPFLALCAFVRVAAFVLIYNGLLAISVRTYPSASTRARTRPRHHMHPPRHPLRWTACCRHADWPLALAQSCSLAACACSTLLTGRLLSIRCISRIRSAMILPICRRSHTRCAISPDLPLHDSFSSLLSRVAMPICRRSRTRYG